MTLCINQPNQLLRNDEHIWRLSFFSIAIEQSLQLHLRPLQGFLIIRPTNPVRSQQPLGTSQSMRNTDIHSSTQNVLWLRQAPNTIRTMYTYQTVHVFLWTFHSIFPPNASIFRSCGCCALVTMPLRIWLACKFSSTTFAYKDRRCCFDSANRVYSYPNSFLRDITCIDRSSNRNQKRFIERAWGKQWMFIVSRSETICRV